MAKEDIVKEFLLGALDKNLGGKLDENLIVAVRAPVWPDPWGVIIIRDRGLLVSHKVKCTERQVKLLESLLKMPSHKPSPAPHKPSSTEKAIHDYILWILGLPDDEFVIQSYAITTFAGIDLLGESYLLQVEVLHSKTLNRRSFDINLTEQQAMDLKEIDEGGPVINPPPFAKQDDRLNPNVTHSLPHHDMLPHNVIVEEIPTISLPINVRNNFPQHPTHFTLVLKCTCPNGMFCIEIDRLISQKIDHRVWMHNRKITNSGPANFTLCVPVYGQVLYSFVVQKSEIKSWDGTSKTSLITSGWTENPESKFYDFPSVGVYAENTKHFDLLTDQMKIAYGVAEENQQIYHEVRSFFNAHRTNFPCRSIHHKYGQTAKLIAEWRRFAGGKNDIALDAFLKATTLSIALYGMCTSCYYNQNAVFSLVQI